MNPNVNQAVSAYSAVNISTDIASANPHKLILMLYEGAISSIWAAKHHIQKENVTGRVESIMKAMDILEELNASLNHEIGGTISINLARLYDYCARLLTQANVNNAVEPLVEVQQLMTGLRDTWLSIQSESDAVKPGQNGGSP